MSVPLDELHTLKESEAARTGKPIEEPIFTADQDNLRWSRFKDAAPKPMFEIVSYGGLIQKLAYSQIGPNAQLVVPSDQSNVINADAPVPPEPSIFAANVISKFKEAPFGIVRLAGVVMVSPGIGVPVAWPSTCGCVRVIAFPVLFVIVRVSVWLKGPV